VRPMSEQIQVERVIRADAGALYDMVADVGRMGDWSPETASCEWTKGATGAAVGATFKGSNRNGKKQWSTNCKVVSADPGRAFAFDVTVGPFKVARWSYTFEPTSDGCRVTETWTDQRGRIATWAGNPASGVADRSTHNRATMEQTLERLAAAAEGANA
jgi:ribosome-associated toxin RatA of RatAB toxin-antitoxin module